MLLVSSVVWFVAPAARTVTKQEVNKRVVKRRDILKFMLRFHNEKTLRSDI